MGRVIRRRRPDLMPREAAVGILAETFAKLPAGERENLVWHAARGTPIVCGEHWLYFTGPDGAG